MLGIYSLAHFCVDFGCAFFIYSRFLNPWQWTFCLVLYNFCAFAMQAPLGLLGDRLNKNALYAAAGCVIVALSAFLSKYALKGYKQLLIDNYLAIYKIDEIEKTVKVITVQYQGKDL